MSPIENIARLIDHTLLQPDATKTQLKQLCEEAKEYGFATACVNPVNVRYCVQMLEGSHIPICTVVGFPLGGSATPAKVADVKKGLDDGAKEFDMVMNIGALKDGDYDAIHKDVEEVVAAADRSLVKVIIETCLLTDEEKVEACQLAQDAGAHFVKTSTGFSRGGATVEDVALMRKTVGPSMGVKASGGIKSYVGAMAMVDAGANRIGASAGLAIVSAQPSRPSS